MITFKELFEKTQTEKNKNNAHYNIAQTIVNDFLKSEHGIEIYKETNNILKEEHENSKKEH